MTAPWPANRLAGLGLDGLIRKAEEIQRRTAEMERQRAELRVTGESPDGLVRATVDGQMKVIHVDIDARAMRGGSFAVAEAIQAAIDAAYTSYNERNDELMAQVLGDEDLTRQAREGTLKPEDWFRQFGVDLDGALGRFGR